MAQAQPTVQRLRFARRVAPSHLGGVLCGAQGRLREGFLKVVHYLPTVHDPLPTSKVLQEERGCQLGGQG